MGWSISFWIVYRLPNTVSRGRTSLLSDLPDLTLKERLAIFLDLNYWSFVSWWIRTRCCCCF